MLDFFVPYVQWYNAECVIFHKLPKFLRKTLLCPLKRLTKNRQWQMVPNLLLSEGLPSELQPLLITSFSRHLKTSSTQPGRRQTNGFSSRVTGTMVGGVLSVHFVHIMLCNCNRTIKAATDPWCPQYTGWLDSQAQHWYLLPGLYIICQQI